MSYVDGFVICVPKKNLAAYRRMALLGRIWMEHGALQYVECVGDDLATPCGKPFPQLAAAKKNELVFFSWILYRSRRHRDAVNAKVMQDPRLLKAMDGGKMPFDMQRMSHGGFRAIVEA